MNKENAVDPEVQRIRAQARQAAQNDPQLQAERQQIAEAQAATRKAFVDLAWSQFFARHADVLDIAANRVPLGNYAISIGGITLATLEESLRHPEIGPQLARITPKKPATKENLAQDEATLRKYCRSNRLAYPGESALRILRDTFGAGFGGASIAEAAQRELLQLRAESDPAVLAEWDKEDRIQHLRWLRDEASPSELRAAVRQEGVKTAQQQAQAQAEHSQKIASQMQQGNYLPLPTHWIDGSRIDRRWLIQISNKNYPLFRDLVKRFGSAQLNAVIKGQ
jgi:hypothetical protein